MSRTRLIPDITRRSPGPERMQLPEASAAAGIGLDLAHAIRSEDLLCGRRAVDILHAGARYRLSLTTLGKLILTK